MDLPFEIEIDEDEINAHFDEAGCFIDPAGNGLDTFTLDLTRKSHRETLRKFYTFLCFDIPLATALENRIKELDDLNIDTEELSL